MAIRDLRFSALVKLYSVTGFDLGFGLRGALGIAAIEGAMLIFLRPDISGDGYVDYVLTCKGSKKFCYLRRVDGCQGSRNSSTPTGVSLGCEVAHTYRRW